jgi:molybdate transport system substrate-binding protein
MSIRWPRLLFLTLATTLPLAAQAADVVVSAAASMTQALRDVAPLFEAAHPAPGCA